MAPELPLGKEVEYKDKYDPELLYPISRQIARKGLSISPPRPFYGFDIWNCYEVSWLNAKGKPEVRILEITIPAISANIVESKSLKLYLNSFNNTNFSNEAEVKELIKSDLSRILKSDIQLSLNSLEEYNHKPLSSFNGQSLDNYDIDFRHPNPLLKLASNANKVSEILYSNLLRSNCPVTRQPDWASVQISYSGLQLNHEALLTYIVSFRNHNEFHEHCVERMFCDIITVCNPEHLTVYARYTRRGGIDINPIRSTYDLKTTDLNNFRCVRQ